MTNMSEPYHIFFSARSVRQLASVSPPSQKQHHRPFQARTPKRKEMTSSFARATARSPAPDSPPVFRAVLTGGPCSGKTSSLVTIAEHFRDLGWNVFTVPEAATSLLHGGVTWASMSESQQYVFQLSILKTMILFEDTFMEIAFKSPNGKPSLVLCDRGVMDCSAYVSEKLFKQLLGDCGISGICEAREERYDIVVHLVTAAHGKESFYGTDSNNVRSEPPDLARELDSKVLKAWSGHPNLSCIDNRTLFKEKVMRAVSAICQRVNIPAPSDSIVKRKFLVKSFKDEWKNADGTKVEYTDCECEYTYLVDAGDSQQRLKQRRLENGTKMNTQITRTRGESGTHERYTETKRKISNREYESLRNMALPKHASLVFTKRSFAYKQQFFKLAVYKPRDKAEVEWMQLEIYEDLQHPIELPTEWIEVEQEVTKSKSHSTIRLASMEYERMHK